jgi:outer membrane lipoprotein SlyB
MICKTLDEMKKLIIIFAATVAALSLSFCSKEESTSNSTEGEYTLKTV